MTDRTKGSAKPLMICWFLIALVLIGSGCGKKYKSNLTEEEYQQFLAKHQPVPETTLRVSSEQLTVDEIVTMPVASGREIVSLGNLLTPSAQSNDPNTFKEMAVSRIEPNVGARINNILLYQKAKKEAPDKIDDMLEKAADRQWRELVLRHDGNEAMADKYLRSRGITRKEFKESSKRDILSRFHMESKVPRDRPISHKEYLEYYTRLKDEKYVKKPLVEFSLIDIQPEKIQVEDLIEDRQQKALALAKEVYDKLLAGADFEDMVKAYSHGVMARQAGRWRPINPASLAPPYDVLAPVADALEPNEISEPIEATGHVFIMKLHRKQTQGYVPMSDVQPEIRKLIQADREMEAQMKLIQELEDIIKNSSEESIDDFINRIIDEIYRRSNP